MQEKELRLALVCFGGISLAIYIHGASKEILKLARASKAFHHNPNINAESRQRYIYPNPELKDHPDTELVYFDILKSLSPELDLRVIVDVIAGASAGGMNSVFLGRALAHDLSIDHLRDHWLEEADVSRLIGNKKPAGTLDKIFSKPLIKYLSRKYLGRTALAAQVEAKLPALMSIWKFKPSFDGKHFLGLMYRGLSGMGTSGDHSLMPYGHKLDLYVTVTDYYGFRRIIPLNNPPTIHEREHRHNFHFSYINRKNGKKPSQPENFHSICSDFEEEDKAALSFAARATASYPGAFPPAQLREINSFMNDIGKDWDKKDSFIKKNFAEYVQSGIDPMHASFLDGSILNNKPFNQAIQAIQYRPAFREVDRRILYIDPNPEKLVLSRVGAPPSLLNTIKGAMSDIPMNEPIHDDLTNIQNYNQHIRVMKTIIDHAKPEIARQVTEISGKTLDEVSAVEQITYLRLVANMKSVRGAGFAYNGYARLKLRNTIAHMTVIVADICGFGPGTHERRRLFTVLHNIAFKDPFDFSRYTKQLKKRNRPRLASFIGHMMHKDKTAETLPSWGYFLTAFDVKYQRRRLLFVIKDLNTYYSHHPNDARKLDQLKRALYDILENLNFCTHKDNISPAVQDTLRAAFLPVANLKITDDLPGTIIEAMVKDHRSAIDDALNALALSLNLDSYKAMADRLIAEQYKVCWENDIAKNLAISYIGFAFWDVMTFSVMGTREIGEFNEVKINRISPKDTTVLSDATDPMPLRGTALGGFGAFFSRKDRENDYLWGRLNSAERLIDLLYNQAKLSKLDHKLDLPALKRRAFSAILDSEERHLPHIPELFATLRKRIKTL